MTEQLELTLVWAGPFTWRGPEGTTVFDCELAAASGIYHWTVPCPAGNLVYYVGQTQTSFGERHWAHWREYFSGAYTINSAEDFRKGKRTRHYSGYAYRRPASKYMPGFVLRAEQHFKDLLPFLDAMEIWLVELEADRRVHRRVEGAICEALYNAPEPAGSFQEPGMRRELRRPDERPIQVTLKPSGLFVGLPDLIVA